MSKMEAKVVEDILLNRLQSALPEHLAGLVDVLTDEGKGRVSMGSAVRELLVKAKELGTFTEGARAIIVDELRAYGGSAIVNLARGEGVPYSELLVDTLRYLEGTVDKDRDVDAMEVEVLRRQLEILWDTDNRELKASISAALDVEPKWRNVEARLAEPEGQLAAAGFLCGSGYSADLIHAAANAGTLSGAAAAVTSLFGGGLRRTMNQVLASGVADKIAGKVAGVVSSHRVTLPSINYLARIRLLAADSDSPGMVEQVEPAPSNVVQFPVPAAAVDLRDDAGHVLMSMGEVALGRMPENLVRLDPHKAGVSRWAPLVGAVPAAAVAQEVAGDRYMKVIVNGPLTMAKDGHGFRGFVQGERGRITEHVRLFEGDLAQVANAAAIFNVASFAVGQKHLADISKSLDEIKEGVDRVAQFQQRSRESDIRGAVRYLQQVGPLILDGSHTPAQFQKLEDNEADLLKLQEHLAVDLTGLITQVQSATESSTFSASALRDRLAGYQVQFEELAHQWKVCVSARMVGCRLLCSFEGTAPTVEARQAAIRKDLDWLTADDGVINRFIGTVNERAQQFTAVAESRTELQAHRELLKVMQAASMPALESDLAQLGADFSRLVDGNRDPVELLLLVSNGEVREAAVL